MGGQVKTVTKMAAQPGKGFGERRVRVRRRQNNNDLPLAVAGHVLKGKMTFALFRPPLAGGQQARQPAIGGPVLRVTQEA